MEPTGSPFTDDWLIHSFSNSQCRKTAGWWASTAPNRLVDRPIAVRDDRSTSAAGSRYSTTPTDQEPTSSRPRYSALQCRSQHWHDRQLPVNCNSPSLISSVGILLIRCCCIEPDERGGGYQNDPVISLSLCVGVFSLSGSLYGGQLYSKCCQTPFRLSIEIPSSSFLWNSWRKARATQQPQIHINSIIASS